MPNRVKVVIVSGVSEERKEIYDILLNISDIAVLGEAETVEAGLKAISDANADVTIVGSQVQGSDSFKFCEKVMAQFPLHPIILLTHYSEEDTFRKAMRSGIKEVLKFPADRICLSDSIYRAYDFKEKNISNFKHALPLEPPEKESACKVISVFSTKGGVGKTAIASNIAVLLKQNSKKVALLDLDLYSGDIALALDLVPKGSISDLVNDINRLDLELLESYMCRHSSGLMVLPAPAKIEYADFVASDHVQKILKILTPEYDYIVVDCSSYMNDPVLVTLEASDIILLVTTLDIFAVKNLKACINSLDALNFSRTRLRLVINRAFRGAGITETDVQTTLGLPVTAVLPQEDQNIIKSINQGIPAVLSYKNSGFTIGIKELGEKITDKKHVFDKPINFLKKMSS